MFLGLVDFLSCALGLRVRRFGATRRVSGSCICSVLKPLIFGAFAWVSNAFQEFDSLVCGCREVVKSSCAVAGFTQGFLRVFGSILCV